MIEYMLQGIVVSIACVIFVKLVCKLMEAKL